jgi:flavin-binding protein dodecin
VAEPFRPAPSKGGLGRSLRSKRTSTFESIEDLLATCERLRDVTPQAVDDVAESNGVELENRFPSDRLHLYRRYLAFCLEDRVLSEEENADLEHLCGLLHLETGDIAVVHDEVAREVYGKAVSEVLRDLKISPVEDAFLRRLRGELHLSEAVASDLLERGRQSARQVALSEASTLDPGFTARRAPLGEFVGRSDDSFEEAVQDALTRAQIAIPRLHWFEVSNISGYVGDGKPKGWHVTVRGGIETS